MKHPKYRKAVFIVTYTKTRKGIEYLLLKRKLHWIGWEFPKGGIKKKENLIEAVKREIKEETGLRPLKIKKFNIKGKYKYNKEFKDRSGIVGQKYILFAVETKKGKAKLDKPEHSGYKWMNFNEAMKNLTWKNQKKCLKVVDEGLEKGKVYKI